MGPEHPDTTFTIDNLAEAIDRQGRHIEAENLFRDLCDIRRRVMGPEHPRTMSTMHNLAQAIGSQSRHSEAEAMFRELLDVQHRVLPPEHPDILATINNLGVSIMSQESRHGEAEQLFREVLEIKHRVLPPEHPDILTAMDNLGIAMRNQGRYDEAAELHEQALEIRRRVMGEAHPRTRKCETYLSMTYREHGTHYFESGLYEQAIGKFSRVLELDPNDSMTWHSRAKSHAKLGRDEEALEDFAKVVVLSRDSDWRMRNSLEQRERIFRSLGRYEEALAENEKQFALPGGNRFLLHRSRADTYDAMGQTDQAIAECEKSVQQEPETAEEYNGRGRCHIRLGHFTEAAADFSRSLEFEDLADWQKWVVADSRRQRGLAYMLLGENEKALRDLESAFELQPDNFYSCGMFAEFLVDCVEPRFRDPQRALELLRKADELRPSEPITWLRLGAAHYRLGDFDAAFESLQKAGEPACGAQWQQWYFLLAMVCHRRGDSDRARQYYDAGVQRMKEEAGGPHDWYAEVWRWYSAEAAQLLGVTDTTQEQER